MSAHDRFPSTDPAKKYEQEFVDFLTNFLNIIDNKRNWRNEALIYGVILFRYPLTIVKELENVIIYDLTYLVDNKELTKSNIKESLERIQVLGLFQKAEKRKNAIESEDPSFIEPGRDRKLYIKYIKSVINKFQVKKELKKEFIRFISLWKDYTQDFLLNRIEEYCQRINIRSSKKGLETLKTDLDDVDGYSEICLVTFSTETIWEFVKNSLTEALKVGIKRYRILLIHPRLGEELETSKVKELIKNGIRRIKNHKKSLRKNGNYSRKDVRRVQLRLIKNKKDSFFFGLLKIAKEDSGKKDLYRCLVKRTYVERGVNAIVLRGHYKNNTLFALIKSYLDSVWKRSRGLGFLGWLKKNWIDILGPSLIVIVVIICYFISRDLFGFLLFFLSGIILKSIYDLIKYVKRKQRD
ncbi:MAG: hypothetical protein ACTSO8_05625 [Promethearchaeota archaeon]